MSERVTLAGLGVNAELHRFIRDEALPETGISEAAFWQGAAEAFEEFGPRIRAALQRRDELQELLDSWHQLEDDPSSRTQSYADYLSSIGYLVDTPDAFTISTTNVDPEIAVMAGPQLVVPLLNARFATNAANARWGSLYDALYGTDVIADDGDLARDGGYNAARGAEVVAWVRRFLDETFPIAGASHSEVTAYRVGVDGLEAHVGDAIHPLEDQGQLAGLQGRSEAPDAVLLMNHGLHVEIQLDHEHPVGRVDPAGVKDVVLEAAPTCIMDLEDSVAAVDAADKVIGYRHWLQLMRGQLSTTVEKNGQSLDRSLQPDRHYVRPDGSPLTLPGRALLLIRQVGHLLTTDAVLDRDGNPVSEGVLDALVTGVGSMHDLQGRSPYRNSRYGSIYAVKPKLHGPDEVALACTIFERVEDILGLPRLTIKIGIMDEERRTSVNLDACIHSARDRVAFINTGFLDRTGDEIRTSTHAGPMVRKADMKSTAWIRAYENANVAAGLRAGFAGRAQIGKGMWAAPDNMAQMMKEKVGHPIAGASCAWVPSPTAATLHAVHYHRIDVTQRQRTIAAEPAAGRDDLLAIPVGDRTTWSAEERQMELDTNVQGVLGYVVRWIDAGVGCSKVPDLQGTQLMEDRATCRISSSHVGNWLLHGVVTTDQVEESLRRMAAEVDLQNSGDPDYRPMAPRFDSEAFLAARELLLEANAQPNGYTEPVLHRWRQVRKAKLQPNPTTQESLA